MYIVLRSPQGIEYNPTQTVIHILLPSSLVEGWLYIFHTIWITSKLSVAVDHWVEENMCRKPCVSFFLQYCSFHDTCLSDSLSGPSRHLRNSKFTKRISNKSGRSIAYNMCSVKKGAANLEGIA